MRVKELEFVHLGEGGPGKVRVSALGWEAVGRSGKCLNVEQGGRSEFLVP